MFIEVSKKDHPYDHIALRTEDIMRVEAIRYNAIIHLKDGEQIMTYDSYDDIMRQIRRAAD